MIPKMPMNRKWTKIGLAVTAVALLASVAFASYTATSALTITGTSEFASVASTAASFSVVKGETAEKSLGEVFRLTTIDASYDDKVDLNVYLLNAAALTDYYKYMIIEVEAEYSTDGGTTWTSTGAVDHLTLEDGVASLTPAHDFGVATDADDMLRVVASVSYKNVKTSGIVAPSMFLEIVQ